MLLAHSANGTGQAHPLASHLEAVARTAQQFSAKWGCPELGYWAGLWHDCGKASQAFQQYLADPGKRRRGPDHKTAGALLAREVMAPLAFAVMGHHGGLPSREALMAHLAENQASAEVDRIRSTMPHIRPKSVPPMPSWVTNELTLEFLIRMVYGALVDADRLDTEAHFAGPGLRQLPETLALADMWERFATNQTNLDSLPTTPVNSVRRTIYAACLAAAPQQPGFFRLTVPTGGGKTRSGLAFALQHALAHGHERVIVGIPYTSIIEQTASTYRAIFGAESVLEHHSAVAEPEDPDTPTPAERWAKLAAENWDAPLVVTTTVQLFESLLSDRSSQCRKLHNIARSVIILDEVQTLPLELLTPIAAVLEELVTHYGVSVVFCTATQPALDQGPFSGLPNVREIIPDPGSLFRQLRRVTYHVPARTESWTWEQAAAAMQAEPQVMAVLNTKRDAMSLLTALKDPAALHLSTQMCGAHRIAVLANVRARLTAGLPCRLVSTQVVEAGVDIDFPVVLRALGPLDRIVQAAGRCNREGKLPAGTMVVFRPADGHLPLGSYQAATAESEQILAEGRWNLDDPAIFDHYFRRLYQDVTADRPGVMTRRKALDYPATAKAFRMIPEDTAPVVVRYPPDLAMVDQLVADLQTRPEQAGRRLFRRLQPYIVNLPSRLVRQYEADGSVLPLLPGLWLCPGPYNMQYGLVPAQPDPADLIW